MARTNVPVQSVPGTASATGRILPFQACDVANGNFYYFMGREMILVKNSGVTQRTVTVVSTPDSQNRSGNCVQVLEADEEAMLGPFQLVGWRNAAGQIEFNATHEEVLVAVVSV